MDPIPEISVCVCTYRRPVLLRNCLAAICAQRTDGLFNLSVVVVDNDSLGSAAEVIREAQSATAVPLSYVIEPERNIALARNRVVYESRGALLAFIDDDEVPESDWLLSLFRCLQKFEADGVLGPVLPRFEAIPQEWITTGGFYDRPRYETGRTLRWPECRTGNVLLKKNVFESLTIPFRPEFGSGGEDQDFFRRAIEQNRVFVWCDEAAVEEIVPPSRCDQWFLVRRALLRGKNSARHPSGRMLNLAKSVCAIPLYCVSLPILFLRGKHHFIKYLVKLADHVGRLLAVLHLNPMKERPM